MEKREQRLIKKGAACRREPDLSRNIPVLKPGSECRTISENKKSNAKGNAP